jgi:hypothetical protein
MKRPKKKKEKFQLYSHGSYKNQTKLKALKPKASSPH